MSVCILSQFRRLFIFSRKKGSSPSLLGNRGLTWEVTFIDPLLSVQNTLKIQNRGPRAINTWASSSPPFLPLKLWPRENWVLQARTKLSSLITQCICLRTNTFRVINWRILLSRGCSLPLNGHIFPLKFEKLWVNFPSTRAFASSKLVFPLSLLHFLVADKLLV